jgi:hypothetical protein
MGQKPAGVAFCCNARKNPEFFIPRKRGGVEKWETFRKALLASASEASHAGGNITSGATPSECSALKLDFGSLISQARAENA